MSKDDQKKIENLTVEKWGKEISDSGFTIIPNDLIAINKYTKEEERLSPTELLILIQILSFWWSPNKLPFPNKSTISDRSGVGTRQVQRCISALESKGFLKRYARYSEENSRMSNVYDMNYLVEKLSNIQRNYKNKI